MIEQYIWLKCDGCRKIATSDGLPIEALSAEEARKLVAAEGWPPLGLGTGDGRPYIDLCQACALSVRIRLSRMFPNDPPAEPTPRATRPDEPH